MKRTQNAEHRTQKKMGKMGDIGAKMQRCRGTKKITNNQDTITKRRRTRLRQSFTGQAGARLVTYFG